MEKIAIHCTTREEAIAFLRYAYSIGKKWSTYNVDDKHWGENKENTVYLYQTDEESLTYCSFSDALSYGYEITPFSSFKDTVINTAQSISERKQKLLAELAEIEKQEKQKAVYLKSDLNHSTDVFERADENLALSSVWVTKRDDEYLTFSNRYVEMEVEVDHEFTYLRFKKK